MTGNIINISVVVFDTSIGTAFVKGSSYSSMLRVDPKMTSFLQVLTGIPSFPRTSLEPLGISKLSLVPPVVKVHTIGVVLVLLVIDPLFRYTQISWVLEG